MILVDTSVWIDHLHHAEPHLVDFLDAGLVLSHPMVTGELALGSIRQRKTVLALLDDVPSAVVATQPEVREFVEGAALYGRGLSLVDAHLLASMRLSSGAHLWTRDKRMRSAAEQLGIGVVSDRWSR